MKKKFDLIAFDRVFVESTAMKTAKQHHEYFEGLGAEQTKLNTKETRKAGEWKLTDESSTDS